MSPCEFDPYFGTFFRQAWNKDLGLSGFEGELFFANLTIIY